MLGVLAGVCAHDAGHVLPDGDALGIQGVGKDAGRVIGALATQGGGFALGGSADVPLREDHRVLG